MAIRLSGLLDVAALQAAVSDVVARHEVLRTVYPEVDGVGYQQIVSVDRVELDLTPVPVSEVRRDVAAVVGVHVELVSMSRCRSPYARGVFVVAPESEYVLVFVVHHISA